MKKRILTVFLIAALAALCGCGAAGDEKTLREHGLDVIAQMEEMLQSEAYLDLYTSDGEIRDMLGTASGDRAEPAAVYRLSMPENAAEQWAFAGTDFGALPESLQTRVLSQAYGPAMISQLNARGGAATLAAASICVGGKTFVTGSAEGDALYLYVYENACPVAVSFAEGEDNSFSASGMFVLYEDFDGSSQESVASAFAEMGVVAALVGE